MNHRVLRFALFVALAPLSLAAPAAAQHVWVVDDSGGAGVDSFTVQGAINLASDGDVILVRASVLPAFVIDGKSLTVTADAGAAVKVDGFRVRNLSASQSVTISGLAAGSLLPFMPGVEVVRINDCDGPVLVQGCSVGGGTQFVLAPLLPTISVSHAAGVSFIGCTLSGRQDSPPLNGSPGLTAEALVCQASHVQLAQCAVLGADGHTASEQGTLLIPATAGTQAIALSGSRLVLLGSSVVGGHGGNGTVSPFSESCTPGSDGGAGVATSDAGSEIFVRASTLAGGAGGLGGVDVIFGFHCSDGVPGAATTGPGAVTALDGGGDALEITPPVVRAEHAGTLKLHGAPGSATLLLLGVGQSQLWLPGHLGVLLPPAAPIVVALGSMPVTGVLTVPYAAPALPAGVDGFASVLQSASGSGGTATLGGGGALVIVATTF
jgi:hypothetical protein